MKFFRTISRWGLALSASLLLFTPTALWSENCPFCYAKAMSSSANMLQAFRHGIFILMLPPFLMSVLISVITYRRRNSFRSR